MHVARHEQPQWPISSILHQGQGWLQVETEVHLPSWPSSQFLRASSLSRRCCSLIMHFKNLVLGSLLCTATGGLPSSKRNDHRYEHVALFSVDGFHSSDVAKYTSLRPQSNIATLLATGYEYTNAFTSAPSDSFPGTLNQLTGASPRTTGVWYDDIWDRGVYPPYSTNKTRCEGKPGSEGTYRRLIVRPVTAVKAPE